MTAGCPTWMGCVKTVAWGNGAGGGLGYGAGGGYGAGYGAGCGAGSGLGMHALAGGCKAACGSMLGVGFLPMALVAAVGFLGYKFYTTSKNESAAVPAKSVV